VLTVLVVIVISVPDVTTVQECTAFGHHGRPTQGPLFTATEDSSQAKQPISEGEILCVGKLTQELFFLETHALEVRKPQSTNFARHQQNIDGSVRRVV
jgi:hypothetical protein